MPGMRITTFGLLTASTLAANIKNYDSSSTQKSSSSAIPSSSSPRAASSSTSSSAQVPANSNAAYGLSHAPFNAKDASSSQAPSSSTRAASSSYAASSSSKPASSSYAASSSSHAASSTYAASSSSKPASSSSHAASSTYAASSSSKPASSSSHVASSSYAASSSSKPASSSSHAASSSSYKPASSSSHAASSTYAASSSSKPASSSSHAASSSSYKPASTSVVARVASTTSVIPSATTTVAKCTTRPTPTLVFNPPKFEIRDTSGAGQFTVKLSSQPKGPVTFFFNSNNLLVDKCSITFDKDSWNTPVTVNAVTPPLIGSNGAATSIDVNYQMVSNTSYVPAASLPVTRYGTYGGAGTSNGDPHLTTFAGQYYSWQNNNNYYMWKSEHFSVQTIVEKCNPGSGVYCHHAFAVRYGGSVFFYDARDINYNTGNYSIKISHLGNHEKGFYLTQNGATYTFNLPDGSYINVSPSTFTAAYGIHSSISAYLSQALRNAPGAGGLWNSPSATGTNLYGGDGAIYNYSSQASVNKFAETWAVPDADNYFNSQIVVNTLPAEVAYLKCTGVNSPSVHAATLFPPYSSVWFKGIQTPADDYNPSSVVKAAVTRDCTALFGTGVSACALLVPVQPYIDTCIKDGLLVDDAFDFGQTHLQDYLEKCASVANSLATSGHYTLVGTAVQVQQSQGFGTYTCPSNCSGHGTCISTGCSCTTGWFGTDCSSNHPVSY
ncbi:hypothetical protein HDV03_001551 [Kappamyces sp. JEL0829]|nr:hypothetical protein HDV03_001551 [Kappamyces sp. JEL0829]